MQKKANLSLPSVRSFWDEIEKIAVSQEVRKAALNEAKKRSMELANKSRQMHYLDPAQKGIRAALERRSRQAFRFEYKRPRGFNIVTAPASARAAGATEGRTAVRKQQSRVAA